MISIPNGRSGKGPVLAASLWRKYTIRSEKIKCKGATTLADIKIGKRSE